LIFGPNTQVAEAEYYVPWFGIMPTEHYSNPVQLNFQVTDQVLAVKLILDQSAASSLFPGQETLLLISFAMAFLSVLHSVT